MTELLTAAQMRAIEQAAIASGEVTGLELMERAGQGVVAAILDEWPAFREGTHRAVVLCGPGNNGGDGFVVARLLKEAGWAVEVFLYGDAANLPPDALVNYERWAEVGSTEFLQPTERDPWACDLIVDAVFGTGLTRPISFEIGLGQFLPEWDLRFEPERPRVVAVDAPSGLCLNSGRMLDDNDELWADLTVTFHRAKIGHFIGIGPFHSGKVTVADIGLERSPFDPLRVATSAGTGVGLIVHHPYSFHFRAAKLAQAPKGWIGKADPFGRQTHKYTHGHALVLSGPATRTGAARLAARGALRIGAGLVTVACPPDAAPEHAARLDAIMLRPVPDAPALTALLKDRRINALCLGPGLGLGADAAALVAVALQGSAPPSPASPPPPSPPHGGEGGHPVAAVEQTLPGGLQSDDSKVSASPTTSAPPPPRGEGMGVGGFTRTPRHVVLDADALTLLARDPFLFAQLHQNCVLTPHAGEFARLFPDIAARLDASPTTGPAYSKVDATRDAAARAGCTVLFKGPDTVIADPSGRCSVNSAHYERSAPWLATAGSGDVLAGFIAGLLARGFGPHDAACTAAWLHVECALSFGPGLIAEDLPGELPKVFRALGV